MGIRRASLILPCRRLEDFPTHLTGERAAELLSAWTALWHPHLLAATGRLPGWHSADDPPEPHELEGELVLLPRMSRDRLPGDWPERVAGREGNLAPLSAEASRGATVAAALAAAALQASEASAERIADFFALGFAQLQVELLTRAMHYASVLDTLQFTTAALAAAQAAVAGNDEAARDELARAFDLLADARNHVYSVDFYLADVTLLAETTLGQPLIEKLTAGLPTSVLLSGALLERLADEHPVSLQKLQEAMQAGSATAIGGTYRGSFSRTAPPESLLAELERGQQTFERHLGRRVEVFAQLEASFFPLLPQILKQAGFSAALHAAFDGSRLPKSDQCKTRWGAGDGSARHGGASRAEMETLAKMPLDVAASETWLSFASRLGDTIAHDHVATVLLAGWPGVHSEFYEDLRRTSRYGTVLGKFVTLDEYFRITREPDEWTTFSPRQYPLPIRIASSENPISSEVEAYRRDVRASLGRAAAGLAACAGLTSESDTERESDLSAVVNPLNSATAHYLNFDPLDPQSGSTPGGEPRLLSEVPACGCASLAMAAGPAPVALAEGRTLRNEQLELTVSETTGGIQSLRTHRDRSTRISQRIVFSRHSRDTAADSRMAADDVAITRNDALMGEITSRGRLLDAGGDVLAHFRQTVRLARQLAAAIVEIELEPARIPEGDPWNSYFASRMTWADDALGLRRGAQWQSAPVTAERIESPDWIEIEDGRGTVACLGLGLPWHRYANPRWLDTLLVVPNEAARRFQFALAVDERHPTQLVQRLLTCGRPHIVGFPGKPQAPTSWFLHVGATNVVITTMEPLAPPLAGIRLRLLETEGADTLTRLTAFRPLTAARVTDFRGQPTEVLSVTDGRAEIDFAAHEWIQLEAEW